jgi:hypothetical protein
MSIKRVAAAAAVAAGLGASVTTFHAGFANSVPCPAWQHDKTCDPPPANPGPGFGGSGPVPTPGSQVPGATTHVTTLPPQGTTTPHVTTGPGPTTDNKITTSPQVTTTTPWSSAQVTTTTPWSGSTPVTTTTPWSGSTPVTTTTPWSGSTPVTTTTPWSGSTTNKPGEQPSYSTPTTTRPVLNAPWNQPPHPPYYPPRGPILRGTSQIGGPVDLPGGFYGWGQGVPPPPPPPPPNGYGWNDGPAPGHPPPNWEGPPPPGGWNGPPPPGGWNRPWDGPPRDVSYGQSYFAPFSYNSYTVLPVFNWQYGGWGYWFDGVWVPLY